jgi:hypothetical protein
MAINNNKFARQAANNANKRNLGGEEKINLDAQLVRLEEDIRRLKIEYDVFFAGGAKRAPYDTKNRVETVMKRLGDERSMTFAQRYQYNSLLARYTSFKELWRRTIKDREEGRDALSQARAAGIIGTDETASPKEERKSFVCSNVVSEPETVQKIYNALIQAKTNCGESTNGLTLANFQNQLAAQTERFKQSANCQRVAFEVGTENGRVIFKAKAEK